MSKDTVYLHKYYKVHANAHARASAEIEGLSPGDSGYDKHVAKAEKAFLEDAVNYSLTPHMSANPSKGYAQKAGSAYDLYFRMGAYKAFLDQIPHRMKAKMTESGDYQTLAKQQIKGAVTSLASLYLRMNSNVKMDHSAFADISKADEITDLEFVKGAKGSPEGSAQVKKALIARLHLNIVVSALMGLIEPLFREDGALIEKALESELGDLSVKDLKGKELKAYLLDSAKIGAEKFTGKAGILNFVDTGAKVKGAFKPE